MRWLLALLILPILPNFGRTQHARPEISYWLKSEPYNNDPAGRVRVDGSTVYTLYEKISGGSIEKWRVTLPERPIHTWVTDSGEVWVLADTTSMLGGPMGGRSALWARTSDASVIGSWAGNALLSGLETNGVFGMERQYDQARSGVLPMASGEEFKLALKNGNEAVIDLVSTPNLERTKLLRHFTAGTAENDPLEELFRTSPRPATFTAVLPNLPGLGVWRNSDPSTKMVLQVPSEFQWGDPSTTVVTSSRSVLAIPSYVVRTPYGRLAWFEFTPNSATLRFLDHSAKELSSVDLLKLGKYASAQDAENKLNYRSIRGGGPYGMRQLDQQQWTGGDAVETFSLDDQDGRQFAITLSPTKEGATVKAFASFALDRIAKKEPSYPDATLKEETVQRSENGNFALRRREYMQKDRPITQLTLLAKIHDPVEGEREVEIWSAQSPMSPIQTRVSDTGEVYEIIHVKAGSIPSRPDQQMVLLYCWDLDGKNSSGYDFGPIALKWFASSEEALNNVDLRNVTISSEGERGERSVDGVPLATWPYERLDFHLGTGQTKTVYVSRMNDQMPPMFVLGHH